MMENKVSAHEPDMKAPGLKAIHWLMPVSGILIGLILLVVTTMSDALATYQPVEQQPVVTFVALMMIAGAIYTAAVLLCRRLPDTVSSRIWIVFIALGLRLTMVTGTPIMEDDHYRYLWDGALVAHGLNPYQHPPSEIRWGASQHPSAPLSQLAEQSGDILERINHPWLRTIYPPVAQAAFGLAHLISPWNILAWRLVLAIFDLTVLVVLWRQSSALKGLMIYGWNPLLIKEVYNSAHVDGLLLPLLLLSLVAIRRQRPIGATAALGVAAGIKLWPVLLMPMIWRRLTARVKLLLASVILSAVCLAAAVLPMVLSGWNQSSGLAAYSRKWEMNDALYTLLAWSVEHLAALLPLSQDWISLVPRLATAMVVVAGVVWLAWRREMAAGQQFLMATTLLFMLSPTQFPWYYIWLLPFLAIHPHPALILYAALLPLYYLRPLMEFYGRPHIFDNGIVWIQHGPVLIWLMWDWIVRRCYSKSKTWSSGPGQRKLA
jgi:hypothetical protein